MQFAEWLKQNDLSAHDIAERWGMELTSVYRFINGSRPASFQMILRAYEISGGLVTHLDWIETGREKLTERGVIAEHEEFNNGKSKERNIRVEPVEQPERRKRGRPKGSGGKRKPNGGSEEGSRTAKGVDNGSPGSSGGRRNRSRGELDSD